MREDTCLQQSSNYNHHTDHYNNIAADKVFKYLCFIDNACDPKESNADSACDGRRDPSGQQSECDENRVNTKAVFIDFLLIFRAYFLRILSSAGMILFRLCRFIPIISLRFDLINYLNFMLV